MAKKEEKKRESQRSLMDFGEENLLESTPDLSQEEELEEEGLETEEEEEEIIIPKKKTQPQSGKRKKTEAITNPKGKIIPESIEEEEIEEEEVESEEDEDDNQEEDQGADATAFYSKVNAITGYPVDVEYGEIDPISPEGVAMREQAIFEKTREDILEHIRVKHPKVYEALEYANNGGAIEDLFQNEKDYSKVTIQDEDEDHAKQVLKEYYQAIGITNEARIRRMIDAEADSEEGLVTAARAALKEMADAQAQDRAEELATQQREAAAAQARDKKFLDSLEQVISTRNLAGFNIASSKEANEFYTYVRRHIQRDGEGGYLIITPVDQSQLEKQLQAEYFKFKNGNLDGLISRKAATKQAQSLRLKLQAPEKKKQSAEEVRPKSRGINDFTV